LCNNKNTEEINYGRTEFKQRDYKTRV